MKTIDLTLIKSNETITVIVRNIKTLKDQKHKYGANFTIITLIDNDIISVTENIDYIKNLINNLD